MFNPFPYLSLSFFAGLLCGSVVPMSLEASVITGFSVMVAIGAFRWFVRGGLVQIGLLLLLFFCLGFVWFRVTFSFKNNAFLHQGVPEKQEILVKGFINAPVEIKEGAAHYSIRITGWIKGDILTPLDMNVLLKTWDLGNTPADPKAQKNNGSEVTSPSFSHEYGDGVIFRTRLQRPLGRMNPAGFDYRKHLFSKEIVAVGFVKSPAYLIPLAETSGNPVLRLIYQVRSRWLRAIEKIPEETVKGFLKVWVFGIRYGLPASMNASFEETGTTHVLAISGDHLAILVFMFLLVCRLFLRQVSFLLLALNFKKLTAFLTLIFTWGFASFCGMQMPVFRATLMLSVYLLGILLSQEDSAQNAIFLALWIVIWLNPQSIWDISFQLSFMAVLAIILSARWSSAAPTQPSRRNWLFWLKSLLLMNISIFLLTLPLVVANFYRITPVSILANLFVVPLCGFVIVPLSLIVAILIYISPGAGDLLLPVYGTLIEVLLSILKTFQTMPGKSMPMAPLSILENLLYGAALLAMACFLRKSGARRWAGLGLIITLLILGGIARHHLYKIPAAKLKITFFYLRQGDAILLETPCRKTVLVDGGGNLTDRFDPGKSTIFPALIAKGIFQIDHLILTHPHVDHMNGLRYLVANFKIHHFYQNFEADRDRGLAAFMTAIHRQKIPFRRLDRELLLGEVKIRPLYPQVTEDRFSVNDNSLVLQVVFGGVSLILTGDIEKAGEGALLSGDNRIRPRQNGAKITILKAPHHGSFRSSHPRFIHFIRPHYVIITPETKRNIAPVTRRYAKAGAQVFSTRELGALELSTDGHRVQFKNYNEDIKIRKP